MYFDEASVYHLENTTSKLNVSLNLPIQNFTPSGFQAFSHYPQSQLQSQPFQVQSQPFVVSNMTTKMQPPVTQQLPHPPVQQRARSLSASSQKRQEIDSRVKVVVRIRPPIPEDLQCADFVNCTVMSKDLKTVTLRRQTYDDREFQFDRVLSPQSSQQEMYNVVSHAVVNDVLKGYNGTILAYGQTGTGKTFTIFGPGTHWDYEPKRTKPVTENAFTLSEVGELIPSVYSGVIPRAVYQIFDHIVQNKNSTEFRVAVSFLQIYMETIMDLLDMSKGNLAIKEDPKLGIFVENLTQVVVQEPQDIIQLIKEGAQNRAVSSTNMNKVSSRSHVILSITLEQRSYCEGGMKRVDNDEETRGRDNNCVKHGVLTIVDLAGSERVSKSGSEGQRLNEAKKINKSLSALGNCVAALIDENATHVPFRDSKLTRLLTDSLGGNSKTCLIATIGPSLYNYDESYSTLMFSTRAMSVKNHAVINEVVDFKTLSGNLQRKISLIENEKYRLMARNVDLEREVASLRNELKVIHTSSISTPNSMLQRLQQQQQTLSNMVQTQQSEGGEGDLLKWEERERELINKFTNIIHHLQMEIAKQNNTQHNNTQVAAHQNNADSSGILGTLLPAASVTYNNGASNTTGSTSTSGDAVLEQLVDGFLAIPAVRQLIVSKLMVVSEQEDVLVSSLSSSLPSSKPTTSLPQ